MAKVSYTVASIMTALHTGLDDNNQAALERHLSSELGDILKTAKEGGFGAFKLQGKGDKAKGSATGPKVEFQGHSTARILLHFGTLALEQANKLGILVFPVDVSALCEQWADNRRAKAKPADRPAEQPQNA